jgi:pimeloyl-ACP methyl ester carboxylesterase
VRLDRTTTVRVATVGEGPPLLLLNGIGGNIDMWEPVAAHLTGRTLVMFDAPGTGGSRPLLRARRMRGYARLVVRLLDELGIDRTDVLGYSWGGALAQELAHRAPDRVGAVVLGATMPGLGGQPPAPWVLAIMATPARYYSRTYLRLVTPLIFGSPPDEAADSSHGTARLRKPPSLVGYSQQLYAISGWSSRPFLRSLRPPVLVLAGSHDPLIPGRNGRILAREIPDARLEVVEGGHLFLLERAGAACAVVNAFLDDRGSRAA